MLLDDLVHVGNDALEQRHMRHQIASQEPGRMMTANSDAVGLKQHKALQRLGPLFARPRHQCRDRPSVFL